MSRRINIEQYVKHFPRYFKSNLAAKLLLEVMSDAASIVRSKFGNSPLPLHAHALSRAFKSRYFSGDSVWIFFIVRGVTRSW